MSVIRHSVRRFQIDQIEERIAFEDRELRAGDVFTHSIQPVEMLYIFGHGRKTVSYGRIWPNAFMTKPETVGQHRDERVHPREWLRADNYLPCGYGDWPWLT